MLSIRRSLDRSSLRVALFLTAWTVALGWQARPSLAQDRAVPSAPTSSDLPQGWTGTLERFASQLAVDVDDDDVGGITGAVTRGDEVVWAQGFGWADKDRQVPAEPTTIYRVGSITKSLTATMLVRLAEEGILSLDDPVVRHLPEAAAFLNESGVDDVTIRLRHLASHAAGLIREPRLRDAATGPIEAWESKVLASIPATAIFQAPGAGYLYSNIGFGTLGLAISRAADRPFTTLAHEQILDPLGMSSSTFVIEDRLRDRLATGYANRADGTVNVAGPAAEHAGRGYKVPNGGLYTDAADLARFMAAVMGDRPDVLGPWAVQALRKVETPEDPREGYGLGFAIRTAGDGSVRMGHGGSVAGYTAQIWFHPTTKLGVVLLRNYNRGTTNLSGRAAELLDALVLDHPDRAKADEHFDILLRGGRVLDGTGSPAVRMDVGIRSDRIAAVARLDEATAERVIDVQGQHVIPGFIDMHSHADRALVSDSLRARQAHNLVAQGITTVVVGPDGRNPIWPTADEMAAYRRGGTALNVVPMVGHGTVRGLVMEEDYERAATPQEIERMQSLVREGMEDGAWGLGAGPEYRPGRFATTEELIALAHVVADYDGFYYAHQRSQSPLPLWQTPTILPETDPPPTWPSGWRLTATDGTLETIRIGRETGIRVVASHIKAKGPSTWGHSAIDVRLIERARADGVQVYLDQYPYETFGGGPTGVIPVWAFAPPGSDLSGGLDDPDWREDGVLDGYKDNLRGHWSNPITRAQLEQDIDYILDLQGGADRHIVVDAPHDPTLVGLNLIEIAEGRGIDVRETLVQLALEGEPPLRDGVRFRPVAGDPGDVETYMRQDYTATSTDAGVSLQTRPGQHPRYYGAFPRKIAHYVKERGTVTLPFAVRSGTGLSAQIIGLQDRGFVRAGFRADLVVFDLDRIRDRATVLEPDLYSEGLTYVMVNGVLTMDSGELTGALPGQVLDRRTARPH